MAQKSLTEKFPSIPKTKTMVKTTKYTLLIVLTALGISVMAQRASTPEQRTQRQVEMLTQMLSLSDAQAQKVQDIVLDFNIQIQKIRESQPESTPWTPDEKLIEKRNASLKEVLTPEQFEKFMQSPMAKGQRGPRDDKRQQATRQD